MGGESTVRESGPGPRLAPEERRKHLLDVAAEIVESEGVSALTVDRVARRAGVSRGLLYTYFDNRAGLLMALWDRVSAFWNIDTMPPIDEQLNGRTVEELFEARLVDNMRWFLDNIEAGGILYYRLISEPQLEKVWEERRREIRKADLAWWTELVIRLGVRPARARVWATLFTSVTPFLWPLMVRGEVERDDIEVVMFTAARSTLKALLVAEEADLSATDAS